MQDTTAPAGTGGNLHPTIAAALAPWTPPTEAEWIAADLEACRRKIEDPYRERELVRLIAQQNVMLRIRGEWV